MKTRSDMSVWAPKPAKVTSIRRQSKNKPMQNQKTRVTVDPSPSSILTTTAASSKQSQELEPQFTLFPKLPPETRNEIWRLSIPTPRIVKMEHDPADMKIVEMDEIDEVTGRSPYWRVRANRGPVPALLHVNRETRSIMSQHYKLFFHGPKQGRPVYFDARRDTLYLEPSEKLMRAFYGRFPPWLRGSGQIDYEHMHATEHNVQRLALGRGRHSWNYISDLGLILPRFRNLEYFTRVDWRDNYFHYQNGVRTPLNLEERFKEMWFKAGCKIPKSEHLRPKEFI